MKHKLINKDFLCLMAATAIFVGDASAQTDMSVTGQFAVNESGAASYMIPIPVPPGTGGIAPKLALTYNSQAGNGLLGIGWSLSGLSVIGRCAKTMAQDGVRGSVNYDANDRFCLDGQRLMAVSGNYGSDGTEYRTEIESYSKVIGYGNAGNGPSWFKVWTKSGQVMEYGNTADSKIEAIKAAGSTANWPVTTVGLWALNKLSDTKGNYFTVSYTEDQANGDYYPRRIDYTGNSNANTVAMNSVQFEYEARSDVMPLYQAGAVNKNLVRLKKISSNLGSISGLNKMELAYEIGKDTRRSRIERILSCDIDSNCLPPVLFTWPNEVTRFAPWNAWSSKTTAGDFWIEACKPLTIADVNGDGLSDLICPYDHGNGMTTTFAQLNSGTDFGGWTAWSSKTPAGDFSIGACKPLSVADVNGDGKSDLVCPYDHGNGMTTTFVQVNSGTEFSRWTAWSSKTPAGDFFIGACKPLTVADVNGDGKSDLICPYDHGSGVTTTFVQINNGASFSGWTAWSSTTPTGNFSIGVCKPLTVADVNGDGKLDLVCAYDHGSGVTTTFVQLNSGTGFSGWTAWSSTTPTGNFSIGLCKPLTVADVNGDGKSDLVCAYDHGNGVTTTFVQLNSGINFSVWTAWSSTTPTGDFSIGLCKPLTVADVNGDGRVDLVCAYDYGNGKTTTFVQTNSGTSFSEWTAWSSQTPTADFSVSVCKPLIAADVNGDGKSDLVCAYDHGNGMTTTFVQNATPSSSDMVSSVLIGSTQRDLNVNYLPIVKSAVYTKDTGSNAAVYPKLDIQAPLYVVSSVSQSNLLGGKLTTNYKYGGLKAELGTGRGMLGFRWVEATQIETGLVNRTEFRQDWPYTGLTSASKKSLSGSGNNGVLSQSVTSYGCHDFVSSSGCAVAPGRRYFRYIAESTESSWDLNGTALPTIITASQYDIWGNATQVSVNSNDGYSKVTDNVYMNDIANWHLGRLIKASVTSAVP
ncbi:hypothetical protein D3C87_308230 [compost metagenome]